VTATRSPSSQTRRSTGPSAILIGLVVVVALAAAAGWALRGTSPSTSPIEISVGEAVRRRDAGAFMLDVRQPEEWVQAHIPGSTLIPLGELAARVREVPRDRDIVVVCRSGNRSQEGRDILRKAGRTRVASMAGGLLGWAAAGHPTVSGP
jgi:rhodanese-related sulfurtransferase